MNRFKISCLTCAAALAAGVPALADEAAPADSPLAAEARAFGYKGDDLAAATNVSYVVTGAAVTNWIPERVLTVVEDYPFTANEKKVLELSGALCPGASYEKIPEGFAKDGDEPWFTWWTKKVTSFGLEGRTGLLTHYDEDRRIWESSESYFSSYSATKEEAEKKLAAVREALAASCGVLKFHSLQNGWIAEYVRLCVMGVVGQRPDGTWSAMLDLHDKCNYGCGRWEPVAEQQARRDNYEYAKAVRAWQAKVREIVEKNRAAVAKKAEEAGLAGFPEAEQTGTAGNGLPMMGLFGRTDPAETDEAAARLFESMWNERVAAVTNALGVVAQGEVAKQDFPGMGAQWSLTFVGDLYQARLDAALPVMPEPAPPAEGEEAAEAPAEKPSVSCPWRILFVENLQPGFVLPTKPQPKKK